MNLARSYNGKFLVVYRDEDKKSVQHVFESIDLACDYMQDVMLINEDEVNAAVIAIHVNPLHDWAIFTDDGKFFRSEPN